MSRNAPDVDELFDVKNSFYVGNYQQAINEAQAVRPSTSAIGLQRDAFLYRSYIAQNNYRIVLQELRNGPPELLPLKTLVDYLSPQGNKSAVVEEIDDKVAKGAELNNEIFQIVAATIYYNEGNYETALKVLHGSDSLELRAFTLQTLLAMNRPDLARKQLKLLQETDDDATLTQLAQAWLNLVQGGTGVQDAHYTAMELSERLGSLGPGAAAVGAAAAAARGLWEEAEQALTEAQTRAPHDPDLLLGLAVAAHHANKPPEVSSRYLSQLLDSAPAHPFSRDHAAKTNEFKRIAAQYSPSITT